MSKTEKSKTGPKKIAAIAIAVVLLGACLVWLFSIIDSWAAMSFARPILSSALIAIIDVALLTVALCLAPLVSRLVSLGLGWLRVK